MTGTSPIPNYTPIQTERTAASRIFEDCYLVSMAQMYLWSAEHLELIGSPTTGDPNIDRTMANSPCQRYLTIADMVRYHREGVTFQLVTPEDSITIYKVLKEHLNDWLNALRYDVTRTKAPMDDLIEMDRLAASMYNVAQHYWREDPGNTRLEHWISQMRQDRGVRTLPGGGVEINRGEVKSTNGGHTPFADALRGALQEAQPRRGE